MKNFFKALGKGLLQIGKTAATNAINNPQTTIVGVTGIIGSVSALTGTVRTPEVISGAVVGLLGSVALVLADDPKKDNINDEKPTDK